MAKSDYRRPADYQIRNHYTCRSCGQSVEVESVYAGPTNCHCGGAFDFTGESYPASSEDWHEERDNVNDEFRNRRGRY